MSQKISYRHRQYDVTILQSRTVNNMIISLENAVENDNVKEVVDYLIKIHAKARIAGVGRKANTTEKRIARLKELGIISRKDN
tara:strand:- start:746 stop:994 length:249 start_codon:yes stop_codon:yes gene_type:complete